MPLIRLKLGRKAAKRSFRFHETAPRPSEPPGPIFIRLTIVSAAPFEGIVIIDNVGNNSRATKRIRSVFVPLVGKLVHSLGFKRVSD